MLEYLSNRIDAPRRKNDTPQYGRCHFLFPYSRSSFRHVFSPTMPSAVSPFAA